MFFPWLQTNSKKIFGDFEIIPYSKDDECQISCDEKRRQVDLVSEPYILQKDIPISTFTLLKHKNYCITDDLDEQIREEAFLFSELLAFSCLHEREFFNYGSYCNRDNFTLIIQGYKHGNPGRGVNLNLRRRDGAGLAFWTQDSFQVQKLDHIRTNDIKIDVALLDSILQCKQSTDWNAITESIILYNLANKDNPDMLESWLY